MADESVKLGKHSKGFYKRSLKKRVSYPSPVSPLLILYLTLVCCRFQKFGGGSGPRPLCVGVQGVLITTGDKEKLCVPEAYSLLNEVCILYYYRLL